MSRLIDNQIWNTRSFNRLSLEDKLLFLYLETSPETNYYGVFILPPDSVIASRTGIDIEKVEKSLGTLQEQGKIALVDDYIIIFNYFDRQKNNESEKTKKGLENFEKSLPLEVYEAWIKGVSRGYQGGIKGVSSPHEENKVNKIESKVNKIENKIEVKENLHTQLQANPLYEMTKNKEFKLLSDEEINFELQKANQYYKNKHNDIQLFNWLARANQYKKEKSTNEAPTLTTHTFLNDLI